MSKILNWVIRSTKVVQENVQRDGWKHVARRYWNNYGQLRFGKLVGEDEFGNRYYEDNDADENGQLIQGRNRWVEYPTLNRYKTSGSKIPPEWHSWLHYTTDLYGPDIRNKYEPRYKLEYRENQTSTTNAYSPSNYMKNPNYNLAQAMGAKEDALKGPETVAPVPKRNFRAEDL